MNERKMNREKITNFQRPDPAAKCVTSESAGRILAIDYGRNRMGLALSDELRLTAQPLSIFARTNRREDTRRVRELCRKHHVTLIVVGKPCHLNGTESEMSSEASRFAVRIARNLGIPVQLAEERLSSWEAAQTRNSRPVEHRGSTLDDVAAAVILRDYLDELHAHADKHNPSEAS